MKYKYDSSQSNDKRWKHFLHKVNNYTKDDFYWDDKLKQFVSNDKNIKLSQGEYYFKFDSIK